MLKAGSFFPCRKNGFLRAVNPNRSYLAKFETASVFEEPEKESHNMAGLTQGFGTINFQGREKSRRDVKKDISLSLANPTRSAFALEAIRSCGGAWFDTKKSAKSNVLSRYIQNYLSKTSLTLPVGNAMIVSYAQNGKDVDSRTFLQTFLDAQIQSNEVTYSSLIALDIARNNFDSALEIYNFCKSQSLRLNETALLALIKASVVHGNNDVLQECISSFEALNGAELSKNLALAMGHGLKKDLNAIEDVFLNSVDASATYLSRQSAVTQACCLLYQSLVENEAPGHIVSGFLDRFKALNLDQSPYYERNLGLTSAHLTTEGFAAEGLNLMKLIPKEVPFLYAKRANRYLLTSMFNNNSEAMSVFLDRVESLTKTAGIEEPISELIQVSSELEMSHSQRLEALARFLNTSRSDELRPHMFYPYLVKSKTETPDENMLSLFAECLEKQSPEIAVHEIVVPEKLLICNVDLLDRLVSSEKYLKYPRFQYVLVKALLFHERLAEAKTVLDRISIPAELLSDLFKTLNLLLKDDLSSNIDVIEMFSKCYHSASEEEAHVAVLEVLKALVRSSLSYTQLAQAQEFAQRIADRGCVTKFAHLLNLRAVRRDISDYSVARFTSSVTYQVSDPKSFLIPGFMTSRLHKLERSELESMRSDILEGQTEIADERELKAKKMMLDVLLGDFASFDEAASSEGHSKLMELFDSHSLKAVLYKYLMEKASFSRAFLLFDELGFWGVSSASETQFIDLDQMQRYILTSEKQVPLPLFRDYLQRLKNSMKPEEYEAKLKELEPKQEIYPWISSELFRTRCLSETESVEQLKADYDSMKSSNQGSDIFLPFLRACLKCADSGSSKDILKELLKNDGSKSDTDRISGSVFMAQILNGDVQKALEFASNRFLQVDLEALHEFKRVQDVDRWLAMFQLRGGFVTNSRRENLHLGGWVSRAFRENVESADESKRKLAREVLHKIFTSNAPFDFFFSCRLDRSARLLGVKVPEEFSRRFRMQEIELLAFLNRGDVDGACKIIRERRDPLYCDSHTVMKLLKLMNLESSDFFTDQKFMKFLNDSLKRRGNDLMLTKSLIMDKKWTESEFQLLLRSLPTDGATELPDRVLSFSSYHFNAFLFPLALVNYLRGDRAVEHASNVTLNRLRKSGPNLGVAWIMKTASTDPSKVNGDQSHQKRALRVLVTSLNKVAPKDQINQLIEAHLNYSRYPSKTARDLIKEAMESCQD